MLAANLAYCQQNTYQLLGDTVFHENIVYSPQEFNQDELFVYYMTQAGMLEENQSDYDLYYKIIFEDKALYPHEEYEVVVIELLIIKFDSKNIIKQN